MRLLFFLFITANLLAQKKLDTVFCDCHNAKVLNVNGTTMYGKTIAPKGFGELKEISPSKQKSNYTFEKEHNSAWYKLIINTSGDLTLNITPNKSNDDYDFMLFKSGKNDFCDSLLKNKINPVRACISRDKEEINGKTGINFKSEKEFVKHGIGAAYCKFLNVTKGDIYYLVLDNVYENGSGHLLEIEISQNIIFNGIVKDNNNLPLQAELTLTNQKGDTLFIDKTKEDGSYNFNALLLKNQSYNLNFFNDSSFSFTKTFTASDSLELKKLNTVLPKLKKGSKYSVGSINFMAGSVQYLPQAVPSMNNLARLLKKNPKLKIKIIGHSNGRDKMEEARIINFTKDRANSIKNYLAIQNIDEKRIQIDGKGDHEMIYKLNGSTTADQQEKNRRVEILVLDF